MKFNPIPAHSTGIDPACSVRLDMLPKLAGSLRALINHQPVAVCEGGRVLGYLVGDDWMHGAGAAVGVGGQQAPATPTGDAGVTAFQFQLPGARQWVNAPRQTARPPSSPVRFEQVCQWLLEHEANRVQRGALVKASLQILRNRLDRHILPCLGDVLVHDITSQRIQTLLQRLAKETASPTTLSQYLVIIRKALKLAVSRKCINEVPEIPAIAIQHKPRSNFSLQEYGRLLQTAKQLWRSEAQAPLVKSSNGDRCRFWILPKNRTLPPDLYWVIGFMVNSFVRPTDIKVLKHKHVQVIRSEQTYLRLTLPETKKHDKPIVNLRPAVRIYEAIKRRAEQAGGIDPEAHVFLPEEKNREQALALLNFWLKWVMRTAGLPLTDNHGHSRTLYSLRHTAITFRLLYGQGIDMLTLARNARTSVDMIENFYASTLSGEMNVGMLQSRRSRAKA